MSYEDKRAPIVVYKERYIGPDNEDDLVPNYTTADCIISRLRRIEGTWVPESFSRVSFVPNSYLFPFEGVNAKFNSIELPILHLNASHNRIPEQTVFKPTRPTRPAFDVKSFKFAVSVGENGRWINPLRRSRNPKRNLSEMDVEDLPPKPTMSINRLNLLLVELKKHIK